MILSLPILNTTNLVIPIFHNQSALFVGDLIGSSPYGLCTSCVASFLRLAIIFDLGLALSDDEKTVSPTDMESVV